MRSLNQQYKLKVLKRECTPAGGIYNNRNIINFKFLDSNSIHQLVKTP